MNIEWRPSGGRGEYELTGRQGNLQPQDLFGQRIYLEVLPGVEIDTRSHCIRESGKPRIRQIDEFRNAHPSFLVAGAMMLPRPRREKRKTQGMDLLQPGQFVVQTVRIDVVPRANGALFIPVIVRLENADGARLDISFAERMARVVRVWTAAATQGIALASAVQSHALAFTSRTATQAELVGSLTELHRALGRPTSDLLPLLESRLQVSLPSASSIRGTSAEVGGEDFTEEVYMSAAEARIERVRQWRLAAIRSNSASAFRRNVQEAYNFRCMFSGQRLPRTDATSTAGVDAAHILPWSRFDLDRASNGLCLNKQCHWAFDQGLLRLSFDNVENTYIVSIPNISRLAAQDAQFDLNIFEEVTGVIPRDLLPASEAIWPRRQYLEELNRYLDDQVA